MTQLSKEQASQVLKHLETVFDQYTQTGDWHLTGPVELAGLCAKFANYISDLASDAGLRPGDISPKLKLVQDMFAVSQDFLSQAHVYGPFDNTRLIDREEFEHLVARFQRLCSDIRDTSELNMGIQRSAHDRAQEHTLRALVEVEQIRAQFNEFR